MGTSVAQIHGHPLRPSGFEEPLFLGSADKKAIAEHLASSSPWLGKAGDAAAVALLAGPESRPCHVYRGPGGEAWLAHTHRGTVRPGVPGCRQPRIRSKKRRVARVIDRWREVRGWWEPGGGTDRMVFRVLLFGGAAVDLALERGYGWSLLRVID